MLFSSILTCVRKVWSCLPESFNKTCLTWVVFDLCNTLVVKILIPGLLKLLGARLFYDQFACVCVCACVCVFVHVDVFVSTTMEKIWGKRELGGGEGRRGEELNEKPSFLSLCKYIAITKCDCSFLSFFVFCFFCFLFSFLFHVCGCSVTCLLMNCVCVCVWCLLVQGHIYPSMCMHVCVHIPLAPFRKRTCSKHTHTLLDFHQRVY